LLAKYNYNKKIKQFQEFISFIFSPPKVTLPAETIKYLKKKFFLAFIFEINYVVPYVE